MKDTFETVCFRDKYNILALKYATATKQLAAGAIH